jgi:hypothetical protein
VSHSDRSYQIHLDSLLGFAGELQHQLGALIRLGGDLDGLRAGSDDLAALGDFVEAHWLMQRHLDALDDMDELVQEVRDTVSFAGDVTIWVAEQYADHDRHIADDFTRLQSRIDAGGQA